MRLITTLRFPILFRLQPDSFGFGIDLKIDIRNEDRDSIERLNQFL